MKFKITLVCSMLFIFTGLILLILGMVLEDFNIGYGIILTAIGAILNAICSIISLKKKTKKINKNNSKTDL